MQHILWHITAHFRPANLISVQNLTHGYPIRHFLYTYATPKPKQYSLALCSSNTSVLRIQKHFCRPIGYRGRGAWGGTPERKQYFLALCISNTPFLGIQKHFCWLVEYINTGVWGATPEVKHFFFGIVHFNRPVLGMGVRGNTPEPKQYFSGIAHFKHPHPRYPKHLCWPVEYRGIGVWGATQNATNIFWHCAFQTPPS